MFFTKKSSRKLELEEAIRKHRPETLESKVFKALKIAGRHGLWNYEIARLGMSADRRLRQLRSDGISISMERHKGGGIKYYLNKD